MSYIYIINYQLYIKKSPSRSEQERLISVFYFALCIVNYALHTASLTPSLLSRSDRIMPMMLIEFIPYFYKSTAKLHYFAHSTK